MIPEPGEDRGVSEVVGFVLVFAVVLISVGLLYTTAFQSMHSYQEGEQVKSVAQGMEALSSNFSDVLRQGGTDQRSGELTLRDGTIRIENNPTISVDIDGENVEIPDSTGSLVYQYGSSLIAYEGGGLFQGVDREGGQSVVTSQPALTCSGRENTEERKAVISLLDLESEGERSIQASGTHRFTLIQQNVESETFSRENSDITVSISVSDSDYEDGWSDTLDDSNGNGWDNGECTASTVVVRIVTATVEF